MTDTQKTYTTEPASVAALRHDFAEIKKARKLRNREAAEALGVSEGETLAAFTGEHVVRLDANFVALFEAMPTLGAVMVLTRNDAVVHEKDGVFENISHDGAVGIALGSAIDLRIFYSKWAFAFAVRDPIEHGVRRSFQFFDKEGRAITKVFLRKHSDEAAFEALVSRHAAASQAAGIAVESAPPPAARRALAEVDVDGFRRAWAAMTDTHEFFGLLRTFGVDRLQALTIAEREHAYPVAKDAVSALFAGAAKSAVPIMVFVGNQGMIQIHTGPVETVRTIGSWLNVLDPGFNLHLRTDLVESVWVVRKPTRDGIVTSVELYDARGDNIAMLFGARKPGQPELGAWRDLVGRLAQADISPEAATA